MEKLIGLLNEYEEYLYKTEGASMYHWEILTGSIIARSNYSDKLLDISEPLVYSKSYKFIQRLVDNDKIKSSIYGGPSCIMRDDLEGTTFDLYESILMLLSISDNPIEDLISYLQ